MFSFNNEFNGQRNGDSRISKLNLNWLSLRIRVLIKAARPQHRTLSLCPGPGHLALNGFCVARGTVICCREQHFNTLDEVDISNMCEIDSQHSESTFDIVIVHSQCPQRIEEELPRWGPRQCLSRIAFYWFIYEQNVQLLKQALETNASFWWWPRDSALICRFENVNMWQRSGDGFFECHVPVQL